MPEPARQPCPQCASRWCSAARRPGVVFRRMGAAERPGRWLRLSGRDAATRRALAAWLAAHQPATLALLSDARAELHALRETFGAGLLVPLGEDHPAPTLPVEE